MPRAPMFRNISAKLALFYALIFASSVAALFYASLHMVDAAFRRQIDQRIKAEMASLTALGAASELTQAVIERQASSDAFSYRLGAAGNFPQSPVAPGWADISQPGPDEEVEAPDMFRALSVETAAGLLTVALDTDAVEDLRMALRRVFAAALLLACVLAVSGGVWLRQIFSKRFNVLGQTADAVAAGALGLRMPVSDRTDEFDRLSLALNRMLDQNASLLEA
jgi:methyl-accepting chemotaxis protein